MLSHFKFYILNFTLKAWRVSVVLVNGECDGEPTAFADFAFYPYFPIVGFHEVFGNG